MAFRAFHSSTNAVLACLLAWGTASLVANEETPNIMNYRIVEPYYGPEIRFFDWRVTSGDLLTDHSFGETRDAWKPGGEGVNAMFSTGGKMQIFTTDTATVTRSDYHYGGGGDVELRVTFEIERMAEDGSFSLRANDRRTDGPAGEGVAVRVAPDSVTVLYRNQPVFTEDFLLRLGEIHQLTLATLAEEYRVDLDGRTLYTGQMEPNSQDNEGWTHFDVADAGVRLHTFAENFIEHNIPHPEWERTELLYEERFGADSWRENWVLNGEEPQISDNAYIFRPMSNAIVNRRFEGPIAVDFEATPVPTNEHSAGITDAIFFWMMDHPDTELPTFMRELPDAGRNNYTALPFYWMDFGGSNNVTTRLRRSPNLRMVRQFTDVPRLMERDRTYKVTVVQHGNTVEYWVDDERWIQAWDPKPLTSGFIGHRAFNAELKITGLRVWRIE